MRSSGIDSEHFAQAVRPGAAHAGATHPGAARKALCILLSALLVLSSLLVFDVAPANPAWADSSGSTLPTVPTDPSNPTSPDDPGGSSTDSSEAAAAKVRLDAAKADVQKAQAQLDEASKEESEASRSFATADDWYSYASDGELAARQEFEDLLGDSTYSLKDFFADQNSEYALKQFTRVYQGEVQTDINAATESGVRGDATDVRNVLRATDTLRRTNTIRASLGLSQLTVSDELMARGIVSSNWSSTNMQHSTGCGAENLAWGYPDPSQGWYIEEKTIWDDAVLTHEYQGRPLPDGWMDMTPVELSKNAPGFYQAVGHYLNLIEPSYTCAGAAIVSKSRWLTSEQNYNTYSRDTAYSVVDWQNRLLTWLDGKSGKNAAEAYAKVQSAVQEVEGYWVDHEQTSRAYKIALKKQERAQTDLFEAQRRLDEAQAAYDLIVKPTYPVSDLDVLLSTSYYDYDGTVKEPAVMVRHNGVELTPGTDYTLAYSNNVQAGQAGAVITGLGKYVGVRTEYFTIRKGHVIRATVTLPPEASAYVADGMAKRPQPVVSLDGVTLRKGADYTLSYENNVQPGTAAVVVTGKGNYEGVRRTYFTIASGSGSGTPASTSLKNATVTLTQSGFTFASHEWKPYVKVVLGGVTLKEGTDYTRSFANNYNAGTATVTVKGKGAYTGSASKSFTIARANISAAKVTLPGEASRYVADGYPKCPSPSVSLGAYQLTRDRDYTVQYRNNVNAGIASVVLTGKGNYTGTCTKTFAIAKSASSDAPGTPGANPSNPSSATKPSTTTPVTPNQPTTKPSASQPSGTKPQVAKTSIAKAAVSVSSALPYSGKALKPAVTVKLSGKTLKAGTDCSVSYKNNVGSSKAGSTTKATVTVTGKGKYTGSVSKTFQIKNPSIQYYVHRQTFGWETKYSKKDGTSSGTTGQKKRLEGIYVRLANKPVSGGIQYRTHVQKIGWQGWRNEGKMSGTTGKGYRLEAIQIKLTGNMAKKYDVYYRVHAQKFGWMGWAKNGASAGTAGYGYRLESIQIKLVPKGSKAPTSAGGVASSAGKAAFSQKRK